METGKFYLIVGVFFQENTGFEARFGNATVRTILQHCMFHGVINSSSMQGAFEDRYGESTLTDLDFKSEKTVYGHHHTLTFKKIYDKNILSEIMYELHSVVLLGVENVDRSWVGTWKFNDDAGLVEMKSIEIKYPNSFWDFRAVRQQLSEFIPMEQIPFGDYADSESNEPEQENLPDVDLETKGSDDDLPF